MSGLTLGAGYHITYGYDTNGRFEMLAWNAAGQSGSGTYSYVPDADLFQGFATASGVQTTYGYEPQRNLKTSVQNRFDSTTISQYDYVYDPLGRRRSAANTGSAFAQAAFSRYGYNDRSELINAGRYLGADINDTADPVTAEQRAYLYDPIGNRTRAEAAAAPVDYLTNELNQYTDIGGALPVYDDDGNMTATPDGRVYTYNAENRLIAAQPQTPAQGDTRTEYVYDYMGRRVQKIVSTWQTDHWSPISEHLYLYDGWNLIKETSAPAGQSAVDTYYVWGLDLSQSLQGAGGVGGLVASVQGSLTYHYLYDANGNVGQVIDAADGSIAAHYEYDPYGNLVNQSGAFADENPYRFSTKYFDPETSLYYYGYRYYLPDLGSWINRDRIGEDGGINLYGFIANDPIDSFDLFGLDFIAVADRAVKGTLGLFYHYSLQYWETSCKVKLKDEMEVKDLLKLDKKAKKLASVELLRNADWQVWRFKQRKRGSKQKTWEIVDVSVSVIHFKDSSPNLAAIFQDTKQKVKDKWGLIAQNAAKYGYAEQGGASFKGNFSKWPNSKYQMPGDTPFNNSNTFIRTMVSQAGMAMFELNGSHPGANSPSKILGYYSKVPWKKGQKALPAPPSALTP